MQSVEQLEKQFKADGYSNPRLHAEAKHSADVHYDVNIKNPRRYVSNRNDNKAVKQYLKNGGSILYLHPKRSRKSQSKVAIPQIPVVRYRSQHKLSPEELQIQQAIKLGLV